MPVLSYVHELFNVAQYQAYIHTLRWKDRPLQCPRCQSHDVDLWGVYQPLPSRQRSRGYTGAQTSLHRGRGAVIAA